MLNINIIDDTFHLKNITKNSMKDIYSIYINTRDFKYATGIFNFIGYERFSYQITQFISRNNVFFLDICLLSSNKSIGLIKGTVIDKNNLVWINSLAIDKPYQSSGYGKRVIEMLEAYFKKYCGIKTIYLSVYKGNDSGINFWTKCGFSSYDNLPIGESKKLNEHVQIMWKAI